MSASISRCLPFVGREDSVRRALESSQPVVVLAGDSGIGKTSVLDRVHARTVDKALAPPPRRVGMFPGSLQVALLDALGSAVAEMARDRSSLERVAEGLARVGQALAESRLRNLAGAVTYHLIDIVRSQLGDVAADALEEAAVQFSTSREEQLLARISGAADPDVVEVVCAIAEDVAQLGSGKPIVVCLDDADRLAEKDQRLLCDLVSELPRGVKLIAAFMTADPDGRDAVDRLQEHGADVVALRGLSEHDVARLLTEAGLSDEMATTVRRITGGYGMYVVDAISLLAAADGRPGALTNLKPSDVLRNRTKQAWRTLDSESQRMVALLTPFSQPVPRQDRPGYLQIDPTTWETVEAKLLDASIFDDADDLWFHELRRRSIWNDVLTDPQRSRAVKRGLEYVSGRLKSGQASPGLLMEYARLLPLAPRGSLDTKLVAAMDASTPEIAVASAVIELSEGERDRPGAIADHILTHARQAFNASGDLVAALQQLSDRKLVYTASNDHATAVVPTWGCAEAAWMVAGRAAIEFGRTPLPAAATALFETALRDKLGPFNRAIYGVGQPSIAELSRRAREFHEHRPDGSIHVGREGPSLLIRGRHGQLPMFSAIAYDDRGARDQALRDLEDVNPEVLGGQLRLEDVVHHPMTAIASLRFARAIGRLYGREIEWSSRSSLSSDLTEPLELEEEARRRVATIAAIRGLCSPLEQYAYQLEEPTGMLFDERTGHSFLARVRGADAARRVEIPGTVSGPMLRSRISQQAELRRAESLDRITIRSGPRRTDPTLDEVHSLIGAASQFNDSQPRREVVLSQGELERALNESAERELADARALARQLPFLGIDQATLGGRTLFMLLYLDDPTPGFVAAAHAQVLTTRIPNNSYHDDIVLKIRRAPEEVGSRDGWTEPLSKEFGISADTLRSHTVSWGDARRAISRALGHDDRELAFVYADDSPGDPTRARSTGF